MPTHLSITEVERQDELSAVYVLNNINNIGGSGNVVVTVADEYGGLKSLMVPETWIPICVTERVPRKDILKSRDFREAVARRILVCISELEARKLMAQEGAREEEERLRNLENAVFATVQASTVQGEADVGGFDKQPKSGVSPVIDQLIASVVSSEMNEITAMNRLRSLGEEHKTIENLKAIYKQTKGVTPKLASLARELAGLDN